jgi:hypothetical protein
MNSKVHEDFSIIRSLLNIECSHKPQKFIPYLNEEYS